MGRHSVVCNEFVSWAKAYEGEKFHAVLCDPPYGLEFMGQEWDAPYKSRWQDSQTPDKTGRGSWFGGGTPSSQKRVQYEASAPYQQWTTEWAKALIPLLHPGALCFVFGGTRTWHRLACGLEDAGFQVWDTLMWLHGQGFPKAQDVGQMVEKKLTLGVARRPDRDRGGLTRNRWSGSEEGTLISDTGGDVPLTTDSGKSWSGHKTAALKPAWEPIICAKAPMQGKTYAELALQHGSGALNVDGGRIGGVAGRPSSPANPLDRYPANLALGCTCRDATQYAGKPIRHTDPNCPAFMLDEQAGKHRARFFYCAKASRSEREAGCEKLETVTRHRVNPGGLENEPRWAPTQVKNDHPTVKPLGLCRWLATLLLPPDSVKPRRLLVPFCGSGSEMIGALQAGWDEIVGVEQDAHYCDIARARMTGMGR